MALVAAFALVIVLTLALRGGRWAAARGGGVVRGAQWIWAVHDRRTAQPIAFYAARDFNLAAVPARASLLALGDPEYILYLNGKRIGAGAWRPGARLDAYDVAALLRPGGNRLVAELRSDDGAGGFLASLVDEADGRVLVATDGRWLIWRRHRLGLLRGWLPVVPFSAVLSGDVRPGWAEPAKQGETPFLWGAPPIGRWGRVTPGWRRPLFDQLTAGQGGAPLPAVSETLYVPPPASDIAGDDSMVLFDWGREVTGYLSLETGFEPGLDEDSQVPPPDRQRTALVWLGDTPPQPFGPLAAAGPANPATGSATPTATGRATPAAGSGTTEPETGADADRPVIVMPSSNQWLDAAPRRFRYALVIGLHRPLAASVYGVDTALAARYGIAVAPAGAGAAAPPPPRIGASVDVRAAERGVFELPAPRLRTPVEHEVRRKLKRLSSVAGGKEL